MFQIYFGMFFCVLLANLSTVLEIEMKEFEISIRLVEQSMEKLMVFCFFAAGWVSWGVLRFLNFYQDWESMRAGKLKHEDLRNKDQKEVGEKIKEIRKMQANFDGELQTKHEMRSFVTIILAAMESMMDLSKKLKLHENNVQGRKMMETMTTGFAAAKSLSECLQQRLTFEKIFNESYQPKYEWVDTVAVVKQVLALQGMLSKANPGETIEFVCLSQEEIWCKIDLFLFQNVAMNLISNARKHTLKGFVHVNLSVEKAGMLTIGVEDTGCGIREEDMDTIFERFGSSQKDGESSGIGLSFVRKALNHVGSDVILVRSEVNRGSYFRAELPVKKTRTIEMFPTSSSSPPLSPSSSSSSSSSSGLGHKKNSSISSLSLSEIRGNKPLQDCSSPSSSQNNKQVSGKRTTTAEDKYADELERREADFTSFCGSSSGTGEATYDQMNKLFIAIVDDAPVIRMILQKRITDALSEFTCTFSQIKNAEELLNNSDLHNYNVVVMDEFMETSGGVLLGSEAIKLARDRGYAGVIIGCSGADDISSVHKQCGADFSWSKPFPNANCMASQLLTALGDRGLIPIVNASSIDNA